VSRQDEVSSRAQLQPRWAHVHAERCQLVHLCHQRLRVDDYACADETGEGRVEHARRHQVQFERVSLGDDRVTGVITAVEAGDDLGPACQVVHHAPLSLVAPLSTHHDDCRHCTSS